MVASIPSACLLGVAGHSIQVEVHVSNGLPSFTVVGLPDTSCREARDRVRAAIMSSGLNWPQQRITVNLAPTALKKVGAGFDLAIALGILVESDQVDRADIVGYGFIGELGLDGRLRPVVGILPMVEALRTRSVVVPGPAHREARLVRPDSLAAENLDELVARLKGTSTWPSLDDDDAVEDGGDEVPGPDLREVHGQPMARLALEVAAAGGHHLLMIGPPGAGKTMLAERIPGILPDLDHTGSLEVSRVHSAAGALDGFATLMRRPPFRAPHHTASLVSLVGGGSAMLRPGEISLASGGVLFLDELGEFPPSHLDALRQPLESGRIRVSRASLGVTLPARFLLIGATNPCPCGAGRWGDCVCGPGQLARYGRRLSGPLLDRFDLRIGVGPPRPEAVLGRRSAEDSASVRVRVAAARSKARRRGVSANRDLRGEALDRFAPLAPDGVDRLRQWMELGLLTMRGAQRARAVALTLMDLGGIDRDIGAVDLDRAFALRGGDDLLGNAA